MVYTHYPRGKTITVKLRYANTMLVTVVILRRHLTFGLLAHLMEPS